MSHSYPFPARELVQSSSNMLERDGVIDLLSKGHILEVAGSAVSILDSRRHVIGSCDIRTAHQLIAEGHLERIGFGDTRGMIVNKYRLMQDHGPVLEDNTVSATLLAVRDELEEVA